MKQKTYVGIDQDNYGGMSDIGKIIRDAWAFGLLPESETCAGWNVTRIEALWQEVQSQWARYDYKVSSLPADIQTRYLAIQNHAIDQAKAAGWQVDQEMEA